MIYLQKSIRLFLRNPIRFALVIVSRIYNAIFIHQQPLPVASQSILLDEVTKYAHNSRNDISDFLVTLFLEGLDAKPKLIVELGVRGGESTFVFERVAQFTGATLVSVDIEDCSNSSTYKDWIFVKKDDIQFAQEFLSWCMERNIKPEIDLLFIDTSHLLEHTKQEIASWFPLTSINSRVIFHDTNMRPIYFRKDGSMGITWGNQRGVIAALEDYFHTHYNEKIDFVDYRQGWLLRHYSHSTGLTIVEKTNVLG